MKIRKLVLVLLAVLVLGGATLGAALAAPRGQDAADSSVKADGRPAKAYLGLETTKLTERIKQYLELPSDVSGLLVMAWSLTTGPARSAMTAHIRSGSTSPTTRYLST